MLKLVPLTRQQLIDIAQADRTADNAEIEAFVADLTEEALYADATEDEIERLDRII